MACKYIVGIWGQFGQDGCQVADGQAVKTRIILEELRKEYGETAVNKVNTNRWTRHPIKFMFESIKLVKESKNIIIMPADNGFKVFVPLLWMANCIWKRNIIYSVIGGFLPSLLAKHRWYIKILQTYSAIFAETKSLESDIQKAGLQNVHFMPNFKKLNCKSKEEVSVNKDPDIKIVYFSRVTEDKGIIDAAEAIRIVNEKIDQGSIKMEVFGLLPDGFKEKFDTVVCESKGLITYKGIVDYDKTVETIGEYFLLVFPTYFHGEGFPGCIIDSFNAGLPVIATDWMYNKDIIEDGKNGLIVPIKNPQKIADAILKLYKDRFLAYQISLNNIGQAPKYSPEVVLQEMYEYIK